MINHHFPMVFPWISHQFRSHWDPGAPLLRELCASDYAFAALKEVSILRGWRSGPRFNRLWSLEHWKKWWILSMSMVVHGCPIYHVSILVSRSILVRIIKSFPPIFSGMHCASSWAAIRREKYTIHDGQMVTFFIAHDSRVIWKINVFATNFPMNRQAKSHDSSHGFVFFFFSDFGKPLPGGNGGSQPPRNDQLHPTTIHNNAIP